MIKGGKSVKFMQVLDDRIFSRVEAAAELKGLTVQELIRGIMIPAWLQKNGLQPKSKARPLRKKRFRKWSTR